MTYQLYHDDCMQVLPTLADQSVDLILCDLPYGTTKCVWDKRLDMQALKREYKRILKPQGSVVLFASGSFVPYLMVNNAEWYKYCWIWVKHNSTRFLHSKNMPLALHEQILVFSMAPIGHESQLRNKRMTYNPQGLQLYDKTVKCKRLLADSMGGTRPSHQMEYYQQWTNYPTDVLSDFPEADSNNKIHTSEKPVPLLEYLIKTYTDDGGVVLDNCMGAGSTGVAALQTGRDFIGIEIDEQYFGIAKRRIEEVGK